MNTVSSSSSSFYASLILKVTGVVLIFGAIVDFAILLVPFDFLNSEWLVNLISEYVGRGVVPLIGVALMMLGIWLTNADHAPQGADRSLLSWSFLLSGILGVVFLLSTLLYFNSSRLVSAATTRSINEQASTAQAELLSRLEQEQTVIDVLLSDENRLAELRQRVNSDEISQQERSELQQVLKTLDEVEADPKSLTARIEESRKTGVETIQKNLDEAQKNLKAEMRKSRSRVMLTSTLLAAGYFTIATSSWGAAPKRGRRSTSAQRSKAKGKKKKK